MDICIDFDGTCVTHEFPEVGKDIGAAPVLKKIVECGHNIILFTMRSNILEVTSEEYGSKIPGRYLDDAINWFIENSIPLYGVNINPTQHTWTNSNKAYGQLYIDDAALGCPLIMNSEISRRPFVDWNLVEIYLKKSKIIF